MIFPTDEYIREESYGGVEYAAPLFFAEKLWEKSNFPRDSLC